jgi:2-C-methyl-D-erythritol 4-phosphate cytidylyltransferase/2-C-methyl-D-erythritol 2,4-cyclodiphosphate synthase
MSNKVSAIVVAAGYSTRIGTDKIFEPLGKKPVLAWSIDLLEHHEAINQIVLVLNKDNLERGRELTAERAWSKVTDICLGGKRRQDSVQNGLNKITQSDWALIHDGARPFLSHDLVDRGLEAARKTGAALAALPVRNTIKQSNDDNTVNTTLERKRLWKAQTPQIFKSTIIRKVYSRITEDVTDDATLVERAGYNVKIYTGADTNIKITTHEDLMLARMIAGLGSSLRIGIGYDVHQLISGHKLFLGGIEIPHSKGLSGHSDADVLIHAIIDALLGAAGLKDIGYHFPPDEEQYKNISSSILLKKVDNILKKKGITIINIDSTIVAEQPKIAPYIDKMRTSISTTLNLAPENIMIKATTTEGLGFTGQGKGIAAYAIASIEKTIAIQE